MCVYVCATQITDCSNVYIYGRISKNQGFLIKNQGVPEIDQIITVLFKTGMAVGGIIAFFLDNAIPGTPEERGMTVWRKLTRDTDGSVDDGLASIHIYDLPFGLNRLSKHKFAKYVPFIPYYPPSIRDPEKPAEDRNTVTPRHDNSVNEWL
jgi:hypothetical protein